MKMAFRLHSLLLIVAAGLTACATRAPAPWSLPADGSRPIEIGAVQVDAATRTVILTGFVNLAQGPIELLACGAGGKRHESVFVIEAHPVDIQSALILIGAKAGPPMPDLGKGPPLGSRLDIRIEWEQDGVRRQEPAEYFIFQVKRGRPMVPTAWVFTGSVIEKGRFKAQIEESFIATYWDPWAIINIESDVGADDELLAVHEIRVPLVGTPIRMLIRLR